MRLDQLRAELERCNRCGACQAACPTYRLTGLEWDLARGRIQALKEYFAGHLAWQEGLTEALDACLTCGQCERVCPGGVPMTRIVRLARELAPPAPGAVWARLLYRRVLPDPKRRRRALAWGRLGRRLLGRFHWPLPPTLAAALRLLPEPGAEGPTAQSVPRRDQRGTVVYFRGCAEALFTPKTAQAALHLLSRAGYRVLTPEVGCCGLPAAGAGDRPGAEEAARRNLFLADLPAEAILTTCPSCLFQLKSYPELLGSAAQPLAERSQDLLAFLWQQDYRPNLPPTESLTFHRPCHQDETAVGDPARLYLETWAGDLFRPASGEGECCGGGGLYPLQEPERSAGILAAKLDGIQGTGVQAVVTTCPSCIRQLRAGLGSDRVRHLVELLAAADPESLSS